MSKNTPRRTPSKTIPLTLFGSPGSGSAAIEMALRAAALPYRVVRASTWEPGPALDELRRLNPLGQIPTLQLADGTIISESAAILIHLGLSQPAAQLLPATDPDRARALRGLVFIAANCYSAVSVSDYPQRWTTATTATAQRKVNAAARVRLHEAWDLFADLFADDPVLYRPEPGALAFLAVVVSQWSGTRQHLQESRPGFHRTLLQLETHPRLQATLQEQRAALEGS
jgi:GST-like protein